MKLLAYLVLGGVILLPLLVTWLRRRADRQPDPALTKYRFGAKAAERTWDVSRDHHDPRSRRQLMAEVKARRVQAERKQDERSNVAEFRRRG